MKHWFKISYAGVPDFTYLFITDEDVEMIKKWSNGTLTWSMEDPSESWKKEFGGSELETYDEVVEMIRESVKEK